MPELPEVEITARKLKAIGLAGRKIVKMRIFSPEQFISSLGFKKAANDAAGRRILDIYRRGKTGFMDISGNPKRALAFHLKMTGNLRAEKTGTLPGKFTRFVAELSGGRVLRFEDVRKFGRIWYGPEKDVLREKYFSTLGKDIFKSSPREFFEKIKKRKGAIKALLLRQDIFSGIGNIIADEALWMAKIHPKTKSHDLDGRRNRVLFGNLKKIINKILKSGGTSMRDWKHPDGMVGEYQNKFLIYGRKNCSRCGTSVKKILVGGRGSSVCPKCQKKQR